MCEPVSITMATMAMAAAGAAVSISGANTQRQANKGFENQKKNAQDDLIIENRRRATHDYLRQVRLEQLQETQEGNAVDEQAQDVVRAKQVTVGTAYASAAERSVAGNSVEMLINDYEFQQSQEVGRLRINQEMKKAQHTENIKGYADQFDQRVAAVKPYIPRQQPPVDYFGPIFQAVSSVAGTARPFMQAPGGSINAPPSMADANAKLETDWTSQVRG